MIDNDIELAILTAFPNETIKSCMEKIDQNKKGSLIIIDERKVLLGSLSDGDIRRAFLAGKTIDDDVSSVYNANPQKCNDFEFETSFAILSEKKISILPIVNKDNLLLGIQVADKNHKYPPISNTVVLMVGGEGQRLGELTRDTPKPLLVVGDKPILQTIFERLAFLGFRNIVLCTRYLSKSIEDFCGDGGRFGLNVTYFKEKDKLGTIGAVKNLKHLLEDPFLVMNGDLLTGLNFRNILDFHKVNGGVMTIGSTTYISKIPYGVLELQGVIINRVLEKPSIRYRVSGGIYVLNKELLDLIPANNYFDITDLIEKILEKKLKITAFPIEEYWLDIGLPNDYLKANIDYNKLF